MTFFLLKCSNNYIRDTLLHSPNGTPIDVAQLVYCSNDFCIYWLDNEFITKKRLDNIRKIIEIESFEEIKDINISIDDIQWNDTFIQNLFNLKNI